MILNKIDAIRDPATLNRVLDRYPNAITVSARSSKGLTLLTEAVGEALGREFLDLEIDVDATDGRLLAFLAAKVKSFHKLAMKQPSQFECECPPVRWARYTNQHSLFDLLMAIPCAATWLLQT